MPINRRNFLKLASTSCLTLPAIATTGCTHKRFYNPDQDIVIGGGRFKRDGEIRHVLAIANLQQRDTQLVDTDFLPHGVIIDPNNKKRLLTFEKNGTQAVVINLDDNEVTDTITAGKTNTFSGHGVFDKTGERIFAIETDSDNKDGKVVIRDSKSFQVIDEFSTFGKNPHDCKLIDKDNLLVVTNSGSVGDSYESKASISYIDTRDHKLIDEVKLEGNIIKSSHFSISSNGNLIVTTAPEDSSEATSETGDISIGNRRELTAMTEPKILTDKLFGEALNICIDEQHNIAAITHPQANLLTFWSIDDRQLFKAMSVHNPRGITLTLDKKYYIVSYGIDTSSIRIRTKDLVADRESIMQPIYSSGDHLINWSKTLKEIMPGRIYS